MVSPTKIIYSTFSKSSGIRIVIYTKRVKLPGRNFRVNPYIQKVVYYCLIIAILSLLIFNPNSNVADALKTIALKNYSFVTKPITKLVNIFTPGSGLTYETIDWRMLWMKSHIEELEFKDYSLSEKLYTDEAVVQRIGEIAWPIMLNKNSKNIFITREETSLYTKCSIIAEKMEMILEQCP